MHDPEMQVLVKALLDGDQLKSAVEAARLRESGVDVQRILNDGVGTAMEQLDSKCTLEQFNLLEIMLTGRAVMSVVRQLFPPGADDQPTMGTVVIASLEGDVHDLGKTIVKMVLTGRGYRVIDCGKDCPLLRLVDSADRCKADAVAVSGLITTVIPQVKDVKALLEAHGLGHVKVLAGGAALKQSTAENLRVDFLAENAFDAVRYLDALFQVG